MKVNKNVKTAKDAKRKSARNKAKAAVSVKSANYRTCEDFRTAELWHARKLDFVFDAKGKLDKGAIYKAQYGFALCKVAVSGVRAEQATKVAFKANSVINWQGTDYSAMTCEFTQGKRKGELCNYAVARHAKTGALFNVEVEKGASYRAQNKRAVFVKSL